MQWGNGLGRGSPENVFEDGTAELRFEEIGRGLGGRASQILDQGAEMLMESIGRINLSELIGKMGLIDLWRG